MPRFALFRISSAEISIKTKEMSAEEANIIAGHITLKEASVISGYAPDYIGQLIRKGKLYGKQVYYKAAWLTTEKALREYMVKGEVDASTSAADRMQGFRNWLFSESRLSTIFKLFLYFGLFISIALSLVLFYVLSVNIERALEEQALQHAELETK